ncbi:MAG: hypothetical protein KDJ44_17680 [Rhodoblastus sp.]|nr:hypothetical protein [Rhodoblastus sp.]
MREILTIIAACLVVALAAALAVPPFVDWTKHGAAIAQKLGEGFGGRVALEGPVRLRLLPAPRLTAGALVAERPGLSIHARATALELSAPALLRGAFEFTEVALERADIAIDPARLDDVASRKARVAVARFQLKDATLRLHGAKPLTLDHVDMSGAADALAGPFRGQGVARSGRDIDFSFATGAIEDGKLRAKATLDDFSRKAHVEATGDFALVDGRPQFAGQSIATGFAGAAPARASFALTATPGALEADRIDARLGDDDHPLNFSGMANWSPADGLSMRLVAANLDLDRFVGKYGVVDPGHATSTSGLRLQLEAESVQLGGDTLTSVSFDVARKPQETPRYIVDAALPGGTRLHYDGAFGLAGAASADGALKVETRDAARLATYVAPVAPQVARWLSAGAFGRLAYDGRVRADADGVALDARAIDLDRSRLSGAIDWRAATPNGHSRLTARLLAPVIDIDSLPDLRGLAHLSTQDDLALSLDAQALRVARIGAAPAETGRLQFSLTRVGGVTTLDDMSIVGLGGANLSGSGRFTAQGGGVDFKLDADRLSDLATLLRRVAPGPASEAFAARALALSPAHLTFGVAMDAGGAFTQANLSGEAGGARYSAQASPAGSARLQVRLSAQAPEAATLLRQAGMFVLPLKGLGGARFEAQGEGAIGAPLRMRANLDLAGLALRFDGETSLALDRASAQGKLSADSADLARLAPLFAFGAPDATTRFPLSGGAQVRFDVQGLALSSIAADVAGVKTTGDLARDPSGRFSGGLALDRLSAPDLVAIVLGPSQPARAGALWPTLKFAAARFDPPQAEVALAVDRLELGAGLLARDARMKLALAPGMAKASDLSMKLSGGLVSGEVAVRREGGAAMTKIALRGEGLAASAGPFAARVSGAVDVSGAGGSMAQLVASLAGSARLSFADTRIAQAAPDGLAQVAAATEMAEGAFDPRAIARDLARDLDRDAQRLPQFASDATIASGRLSLAPVELRLGEVQARLTGALDLRSGDIDARETLSLPAPQGWKSAPRIEIGWSGDASAPVRAVNADALIGALAERAIAREAERNAALEADIHERAFFNRRLKMDRRNDEERRAVEEAKQRAIEDAKRAAEEARRAAETQKRAPLQAAPSPAKALEHPKPPSRPPAAFAPATRGAAPDPSTAGRY